MVNIKKAQKINIERFRTLSTAVEQTDEHVVITDQNGIIEYVNPAFEKTTGYTKEEVIGKTPAILKSGKHNDHFYKNLWNIILSGKTFQGTITNKKKNGDLYYADQTITPIKNASGEIRHFVSIWKDITERIRTQNELEKLHNNIKLEKFKLEQILSFDEKISSINNLNKLIDFVISQSSTILESERCSLMLLDENTGELHIRGAIGLDDKIIKESKLNLGEDIAGLVAQQGKPLLVKIVDTDERISRGNLPFYKSRSFLSVPIMLDQKLIGVVNVTDKKNSERNVYTELDLKILLAIVRHAAVAIENAQLYKELKYLTITDPLTNLYNYRHLMESLKYEISRFNHFKRPLCLMLIDVDDFKDYNDAFGHLEGDLLLKKVSALLKQTLRDVDIVCRYAGDEFVVILGETKIAEAKLLAKKVMTAVKKLKLNRDMTLSIGLAKCVKIMNRHALILKADSALYQAKKDGKNRIYCQDS